MTLLANMTLHRQPNNSNCQQANEQYGCNQLQNQLPANMAPCTTISLQAMQTMTDKSVSKVLGKQGHKPDVLPILSTPQSIRTTLINAMQYLCIASTDTVAASRCNLIS